MKKIAIVLSIALFLSIITFAYSQEVSITQSVESLQIIMNFDSNQVMGEICEVIQLNDGSIIGIGSTGDISEYMYSIINL